jgi:hypothetical protein
VQIQTGQFEALLTGPVMAGFVERSGQVGIERPHALGRGPARKL